MKSNVLEKQRAFFLSRKTHEVSFRLEQLKALAAMLNNHEEEWYKALEADLKKPALETYLSEISPVLTELSYVSKNLAFWSMPSKVPTPWFLTPSKSLIVPEPRGVVLIISAWNFPLHLPMWALIDALAAGNCAVIKPSEHAPATSNLLAKLIAQYFDPAYITVEQGGPDQAALLAQQPFDYIFFIGNKTIGKKVMAAASEHVTPLSLELGGKCPCIVDTAIDCEVAIKRIAWGKFLNAGQTCVAPDYILVDERIKDTFIEAFKRVLNAFYGAVPRVGIDYASIVNEHHFDRLIKLMGGGRVIYGGQSDRASLMIAPTLLDQVDCDHALMHEEIFGPLLPIIGYKTVQEAFAVTKRIPQQLALYIFSKNKTFVDAVLKEVPAGGVTVNDTLLHATSPMLPFGGTGGSGFGKFHGKAGFDAFSHHKSVLKRTFWFDVSLRYPPYGKKLGIIKRLYRIFGR